MAQDIGKIGLDVSELLKELKKAHKAWGDFRRDFSKGVTIQIDSKSIKDLGREVSSQMKAVVAEVLRTTKAIESNFAKGTKAATSSVQQGAKQQQSALKQTAQAARATGKAMEVALADGGRAVYKTARDFERAADRVERLNERIRSVNAKSPGPEIPLQSVGSLTRVNALGNAEIDPAKERAVKSLVGEVNNELKERRKILRDGEKDLERYTVWFDRIAKKERETARQVEIAHGQANKLTEKERRQRQETQAKSMAWDDKVARLHAEALEENQKRENKAANNKLRQIRNTQELQAKSFEFERNLQAIHALALDKNAKRDMDAQRRMGQGAKAQVQALQMLESHANRAANAFDRLQQKLSKIAPEHRSRIQMPSSERELLRPDGRYNQSAYDSVARQINALTREVGPYRKTLSEAGGEAQKLVTSHRSIAGSLAASVASAAKWILLYRGVHSVINSISMGMRTIVRSGLEYAEQAELQKLGLSGILAENFKVEDSQGRQVTGMAAVLALQSESEKQWRMIQSSALAVVGQTSDLMMLYEGILPHAVRLRAENEQQVVTTERLVKLVQSAAVARGLMDISFQDTRTALITMLQGRTLARNRLITALGVDKDTLNQLKGTGALFDYINSKLDEFGRLAGKAEMTFGAMKEAIKDVIGVIGSAVVQPGIDLFKQIVGGVGRGGIIGKFFQRDDVGQFKPTVELENGLRRVKEAAQEALGPIREFLDEIGGRGRSDFEVILRGLTAMGKSYSTVIVWIAKAVIALTKFVSEHQGLIKVIMAAAVAWALWNNVVPMLTNLGAAFLKFTGIAKASGVALVGWRGALMSFVTGGVVGAVVGALALIGLEVEKYISRWQRAKAAQDALLRRDIRGVINNRDDSGSAEKRAGDWRSKDLQAARLIAQELNEKDIETFKHLREEVGKLQKQHDEASQENRPGIMEKLIFTQEQADGIKQRINDQLLDLHDFGDRANSIFEQFNTEIGDAGKTAGRPGIAKARQDQLRKQQLEMLTTWATLSPALERAQSIKRKIDALDQSALTGIQAEEKEKPDYRSRAESEIREFNAIIDAMLKLEENRLERREITHEQFISRQVALEQERADWELRVWEQELERWNAFVKAKGDVTDERDADRKAEIQAQVAEARFKRTTAIDNAKTARQRAAEEREEALRNAQADVDKIIADIYGRSTTKVETVIKDKIADIRRRLLSDNRIDRNDIDRILSQVDEAVIQAAITMEGAQERYNAAARGIEALSVKQAALDRSFENGRISIGEYVDQLERLREEHIKYLKVQQAALAEQISLLDPVEDIQTIQELSADLDAVEAELQQIQFEANRVREAFDAWSGLSANLQTIGSIFDGWTTSISGFLGVLDQAIQKARAITELSQSFRSFGAAMQRAGAGNFLGAVGSGIGSLFGIGKQGVGVGQMMNAVPTNIVSQGISAGGTLASSAGNAASVAGTVSKVASIGTMVTGIFAGVGAALSIGAALFQAAVERAKRGITKAWSSMTKSLEESNAGTGEAFKTMEETRLDLIKKYSKSKSGRAALKEILPQIDQDIEAMKKRIKEIRKMFEEKMRDMSMGSGPFADFARMLMDLERQSKEYLDSFQQGTEGYIKALANVQSFYTMALNDARRKFESQMLDFKSQAIGHVESIFGLMDERISLFEQLRDLDKERRDIQREAVELEEAKLERVKEIERAQKKISDLIKEAAEAEAGVRRRGLVEAQLTVAQQKALEISQIRQSAAESIADAQDDLRDLEQDTSLIDREQALIDRRDDFEMASQKLQWNLELNAIRIQGAIRIAELESDIFNTSGSQLALEQAKQLVQAQTIEEAKGFLTLDQERYDMEKARRLILEDSMDTEYQLAAARKQEWLETAALIQSIIEMGDGVLFNPPPNFPQIRVTIGTISIDNRDSSYQDFSTPEDSSLRPGVAPPRSMWEFLTAESWQREEWLRQYPGLMRDFGRP